MALQKEECLMSREQKQDALDTLKTYISTKSAATGCSSINSILLYCPTVIVNEPATAYTDGICIYLGNPFFQLPYKEQAGVLLHEVFHIALLHIPRAKRLGEMYHFIWNLATDCMINYTIGLLDWCKIPSNGVFFKDLIKPEDLRETPEYDWTSEDVYIYLLENKCKAPKDFEGDLKPTPGPISDKEAQVPTWVKDELLKGDDQREAEWKSRMEEVTKGNDPLGVFKQLRNEFPDSAVNWVKEFRPFMIQPLMPKKEQDWSRPSRRMAITGSRIFEPARKKKRGVAKAAIGWDTSGSIYADPILLNQTVSEVQEMQDMTGCDIDLIMIDTEVQARYRITKDGACYKVESKGDTTEETLLSSSVTKFKDLVLSNSVKIKGGGGSDMAPALEAFNRTKEVQVAAFFTDMEVNFGQAPGFPVLWVAYDTEKKAPFGKTIKVNRPRI